MTTTTTIEVFQKAAQLGLKLGVEPPDTLTLQPAANCPAEFADQLRVHKWHLLVVLQLGWIMVHSKAIQETVLFCHDEATKAALIEAGAPPHSIYTRPELLALLKHHRQTPLSVLELVRLHHARRLFNGTITE